MALSLPLQSITYHMTRAARLHKWTWAELVLWVCQVHLEPAQLHLEPPTAQQFHTDLQELFSTGAAPIGGASCRQHHVHSCPVCWELSAVLLHKHHNACAPSHASLCACVLLRGLMSGVAAGISPREVERTREGRKEHVVWEKRRRRTGLCHFSDYYVGRPALRSTTESYKETVFELQPDQIMACFCFLLEVQLIALQSFRACTPLQASAEASQKLE